jgi:hypothetical protein
VSRAIGWYLNKDGKKKIMWVHAPLGYGKTAIAGTVKEKLDVMDLDFDNPVGATFFFWRTSPERNSPARFIITLAYQLAESIPKLQPHVDAVIKSKPGIVKMALERQLDELIVKPFKSLSSLEKEPVRLIIVDGIDECINSDREARIGKKDAEDQEAVQVRVLDLILRLYSHNLPLRFLVLSRPEAWIDRHLRSPRFRDVVEPLDLYEVGDHMNDVKQFVRTELSRIADSFGLEGVDEEWADEPALVQKSEGHMIYAATVIRHIDDTFGAPQALLRDLLRNSSTPSRRTSHSTPLSPLYELYRQIMRYSPERIHSLLTEVLEDAIVSRSAEAVFQDPRHGSALRVLDDISGRQPGDGLRALRPLHAVLRIGNSNEGTRIGDLFIHSSFREFLEDSQLSSEFTVDVRKGGERLLANVLERMTTITADTIGNKLEEADVFALDNWCRLWESAKEAVSKSRETHRDLMNTIGALDLTTCIIQYYLCPNFGYTLCEDVLYPLIFCSQLSEFFVGSRELDGHPDILSVVHMVTSHTQASLDHAFTALLKESTLPAFSINAVRFMAVDCGTYLSQVMYQPDWKANKVVQAMGHPGPDGIDMCDIAVDCLCDRVAEGDGQHAWDLLEHIYEVMVQEKNPILEEKDHPLRGFLKLKAAKDWESDSSELSLGSNQE